MKKIFSLGLDYENQRAYDKVSGDDLIYWEIDSGGG